MGLDHQIRDQAQGLDAREKSSGVLTAESRFPPAIDQRFDQDLDIDPRPLP